MAESKGRSPYMQDDPIFVPLSNMLSGNVPAALDAHLMSVEQAQGVSFGPRADFTLNPRTALEGRSLRCHEAETEGPYVIANNRKASYWREAREAPDPDNHQHDNPRLQRDGLKSLILSVRTSAEDAWEDIHLLPRHSAVRRQALALNRAPKDTRADFVNYFFDRSLENHLLRDWNSGNPIRIHQAVSGIATFNDNSSASVVGLRVGSMTAIGWIYCGYWDHGNQFISCDLVLSDKLDAIRTNAISGAADNGSLLDREAVMGVMDSSDDSADDVVMRRSTCLE